MGRRASITTSQHCVFVLFNYSFQNDKCEMTPGFVTQSERNTLYLDYPKPCSLREKGEDDERIEDTNTLDEMTDI